MIFIVSENTIICNVSLSYKTKLQLSIWDRGLMKPYVSYNVVIAFFCGVRGGGEGGVGDYQFSLYISVKCIRCGAQCTNNIVSGR